MVTNMCNLCGSYLKGRKDKKFCDDTCRNAYNNNLNSDVTNFVRKINSILKKNRRIIETLILADQNKVPRQTLIENGYNFLYHTHIKTTKKTKMLFFCYEFGYVCRKNKCVLIKGG